MKYLYTVLLLLISLGWSQPPPAYLTILSQPEQVQVRLDLVIIGTTPIHRLKISPGAHSIEALSPYDGLWNIANITKSFAVKSGSDTTIHIRFQRPVAINSIPYAARLIRNDLILGLTPLMIPFDDNRGKEFLLEKEGYRSFRFVLEKPKNYLFELQPIQPEIAVEERPSFTYSLLHTRLKSKFIFLTGTVATHWLAFYFKNVADENYDKYARTADPRLMKKYWDETRKYDRLSDITLGISYALLSGLIYTVLWR